MSSGMDWAGFLSDFHRDRPGITEDVLEHARDSAGSTAYDWIALPVPQGAQVLDVACGSGPVRARLRTGHYVGADLSRAELDVATARGLAVVQADAVRLPFAAQRFDAVTMSMALMLVPLAPVLAEVARVLRPGGLFVATVPASRPMPRADWLRYARLCLALRHPRLSYPNDAELRSAQSAFRAAGLELQRDESRAFACALDTEQVADRLLASLYLPGVAPERMVHGQRVVRSWVGSTITTPLRLLVART